MSSLHHGLRQQGTQLTLNSDPELDEFRYLFESQLVVTSRVFDRGSGCMKPLERRHVLGRGECQPHLLPRNRPAGFSLSKLEDAVCSRRAVRFMGLAVSSVCRGVMTVRTQSRKFGTGPTLGNLASRADLWSTGPSAADDRRILKLSRRIQYTNDQVLHHGCFSWLRKQGGLPRGRRQNTSLRGQYPG